MVSRLGRATIGVVATLVAGIAFIKVDAEPSSDQYSAGIYR